LIRNLAETKGVLQEARKSGASKKERENNNNGRRGKNSHILGGRLEEENPPWSEKKNQGSRRSLLKLEAREELWRARGSNSGKDNQLAR